MTRASVSQTGHLGLNKTKFVFSKIHKIRIFFIFYLKHATRNADYSYTDTDKLLKIDLLNRNLLKRLIFFDIHFTLYLDFYQKIIEFTHTQHQLYWIKTSAWALSLSGSVEVVILWHLSKLSYLCFNLPIGKW